MKGEEPEVTPASPGKEGTSELTLEALQRQLDELKLKVLKVSRMTWGQEQGLIHSGATHPLGPARPEERLEDIKDGLVTLSSGEKKLKKS